MPIFLSLQETYEDPDVISPEGRGSTWIQRYGLVPEEKLFVCFRPAAPRTAS